MKLTKEQNELVINTLNAGAVALVGEWRGAKAETIRWGAREGRNAGEMSFETHMIEYGEGVNFAAISVKVRIPDGVNAQNVTFSRFQRGQAVLVRLRNFSVQKGQVVAEAEEILPL